MSSSDEFRTLEDVLLDHELLLDPLQAAKWSGELRKMRSRVLQLPFGRMRPAEIRAALLQPEKVAA